MFQCFILPLCPCPIKQKKKTYLPVTEHSKRIRVPTGLLAQVSSLITLFLWSLAERCTQTLDPGPCREYVVKWYYDPTANSCAQFWFGGCLGNDNKFDTEKSCKEACVKAWHAHACSHTHTHMKCLEKILIQIDVRFTRKFTSVSEYSCSYFDTDR